MYYDGVFVKSFDYIALCCQYLIDMGIAKTSRIESVRSQIDKSIRNNGLYKKHYSFQKKDNFIL
jgi:hypothetical protein